MDHTSTNKQQSAVGRASLSPNSPSPAPHGRGRGRGRGRAVSHIKPPGAEQRYGYPVAAGHRPQQGFDHSRVQLQQPQRLLGQGSRSSETAGQKQLPSPVHRVTISADKDRLCREWHRYTRAMRAQQPGHYGHVVPTKINHFKQLGAWLDRATQQPLQVKQELDTLLPTDGYSSFDDGDRLKVRMVEQRCFAALNPGHDIASLLADIPSDPQKVMSQEQQARATEAASRLAGWLLHFRSKGRQRVVNYYLHRTVGGDENFKKYVDHLFQLQTSWEGCQQLEIELMNLFDSGFAVPREEMPAIRTLLGIICEKRYGVPHPIERELHRAKTCSDPNQTLKICAAVAQESHWFIKGDWINLCYIRLQAVVQLGRRDLIESTLLAIEKPYLLSFKYHEFINHGFYGHALNTIARVYKIFPPEKIKERHEAQRAELYIRACQAREEWQKGQVLKPEWRANQGRSSWQRHRESLLDLCRLATPDSRQPQQGLCPATLAYLVSNLSESDKMRYVQGRVWESGCERIYYNHHLMATRVDRDDRRLTLWSNRETGNPHPDSQLFSLFDHTRPDTLDVVTIRSPCHNPERTPGGCIQDLRDLIRWYPACRWDYRYLIANFRELITTGMGEGGATRLHSIYTQTTRQPLAWRKLPAQPSQLQLDTYELNQYNNVRYGCYDLAHNDWQPERADTSGPKPHGIEPADATRQLKNYIESHWAALITNKKAMEAQDEAAPTRKNRDRLNAIHMAVIDNLERYCSVNLCLCWRQWSKIYYQLLSRDGLLFEGQGQGLALHCFARYLFQQRHPDNVPDIEQPEQLVPDDLKVDCGENYFLRGARCYCLARLLTQQWFPSKEDTPALDWDQGEGGHMGLR